ncbi:hypothetical protein, partial [uncultured Algoriphagus sp.]|uniref:hypothetical protein n=1 Tax=uncultured Algoriphagus sp. TaxID=417365 RepID=UPI0032B23AB4
FFRLQKESEKNIFSFSFPISRIQTPLGVWQLPFTPPFNFSPRRLRRLGVQISGDYFRIQ